jgi:phosphatidylserine synthase
MKIRFWVWVARLATIAEIFLAILIVTAAIHHGGRQWAAAIWMFVILYFNYDSMVDIWRHQ